MLSIIQYEVYAFVDGRWSLHARYPSAERREALMDARATEATTNNPTKVVRDAYFPETNSSEENTIYLSPRMKNKQAAAAARNAARGKGRVARRRMRGGHTANVGFAF